MKRCTIHATIALDIVGDTDEEIAEHFADCLDGAQNSNGIRSITLQDSTTVPVPFTVPPGADRWAAAAEFRFGEERKLAPLHDGSWWWTDGHAAFRADGDPPDDFKSIPDAFLSDAFGGGKGAPDERRTEWGAPTKKREDNYETRCSMLEPGVAIQRKYHDTVMTVFPSAYWTTTGEGRAVRAYADGKLVAVVMPVRLTVRSKRAS